MRRFFIVFCYFDVILFILLTSCSSVDKRVAEEKSSNPNITNQEVMDKMMREKVGKMKQDGNADLVPEYMIRQYSILNISDIFSEESIKKYRKRYVALNVRKDSSRRNLNSMGGQLRRNRFYGNQHKESRRFDKNERSGNGSNHGKVHNKKLLVKK